MLKKLPRILVAVLFFTAASASADDPLNIGGHVKYQASYLDGLGSNSSGEINEFDGRLKQGYQDGAFSFDVHEQLLAVGTTKTTSSIFGLASPHVLPSDRLRALRMTETFSDTDHGGGVVRLDRFSLSYSSEVATITAGRQAYSLGNGLNFSVMDLLNPFSPVAIDKDYKPGDDLLLVRLHLLDEGDTDIVIAPRRDLDTAKLESDASSAIINQKFRIEPLSLDALFLLGGQDGHLVYGAGGSRDVLGATVRSDVLVHQFDSSVARTSFLLNADAGFECMKRNCYGSLEFFHSGVGSTSDGYYLPNQRRDDLVSYGELYTLGKNYTAIGGRVELSPLMNLYLSHISNLQDRSSVVQARVLWDVWQNTVVQFGVTSPIGNEGDEFGRAPLPLRDLVKKNTDIFLRLEYYF